MDLFVRADELQERGNASFKRKAYEEAIIYAVFTGRE